MSRTISQAELVELDLVGLRLLTYGDFTGRLLEPVEIRHMLDVCEAAWLHDGDVTHPHAELISGKCSNGYVNMNRVLQHPNLAWIFGREMAARIQEHLGRNERIDWVIGSSYAGITISFATAYFLGAKHGFTTKARDDDKKQVWDGRFSIDGHEHILGCEDLVTTTQTALSVRAALREGNKVPVTFVDCTGCFIHRSPEHFVEGKPLIYGIHFDIEVWEPASCPLCAAGSQRLRPKEHWAELTGKAA